MALNTEKQIKSVTYNGTEIPLVSGGDTSETWVLNEGEGDWPPYSGSMQFTSNGTLFYGLTTNAAGLTYYLDDTLSTELIVTEDQEVERIFTNPAYRKITLAQAPTGDLLTWLQANGVKQDSTLATQDTKSVTITENGTTEITPDAPYDAVKKVNVSTNVGGSGMDIVNFTIKITSPVASGWSIAVTNTSGVQLIESKGSYTAYKNSLVLIRGIVANMSSSSGLQRVTNSEKVLMGYLITGDAIFYV